MKKRTKIKICGLRRREDAEMINEYRPDYAGFIINFPRSFRSLTETELEKLTPLISDEIQKVGVFVNQPEETVIRLLLDGVIDLAQLHGEEDPEYVRRIQKETQKPVIKVFKILSGTDIQEAEKSPADYVLLDKGYGEGVPFDWDYLREIHRDYFLAGGLGPDNLREAMGQFEPFAVDMSSSLETERCKDPQKIRQVMKIIRERNQPGG